MWYLSMWWVCTAIFAMCQIRGIMSLRCTICTCQRAQRECVLVCVLSLHCDVRVCALSALFVCSLCIATSARCPFKYSFSLGFGFKVWIQDLDVYLGELARICNCALNKMSKFPEAHSLNSPDFNINSHLWLWIQGTYELSQWNHLSWL